MRSADRLNAFNDPDKFKGKISKQQAELKTLSGAFSSASRIEKAIPRPGSMRDIEDFENFAAALREKVAFALLSNNLNNLYLELPDNPYAAAKIIPELKIHDLVLLNEPTAEGWRRSLVGHNFVSPITSGQTDN